MVSPAQKRRAARSVVDADRCTRRQACRYLGLPRSTWHYAPLPPTPRQIQLEREIVALSRHHPRYGYRRIHAVLPRKGLKCALRTVQRVRRREGLQITSDDNNLSSFVLNFTDPYQGFRDDGLEGKPLFSLYPTGGNASTRGLVNMSVLIHAKIGAPCSFGFVIGGTAPWREILIRAVGPSLAQFGISDFAMIPTYSISNVTPPSPAGGVFSLPSLELPGTLGTSWSANASSTATLTAESARAGAFPFLQGSADKADAVLLSPGTYTITVSPHASAGEGSELIEVYEVE